ncbi:alpha-L-fucosidase [Paenibacillus sp. P36]|uniref:alpha-L-fucosidase n=1 Tax=Paenibacillus sp. P36 TaxID=3342538 RepID=UPI0038B29126
MTNWQPFHVSFSWQLKKPFLKTLAGSASLILSCELLAPFGTHAATTYQPTWESVDQHKAAPEWFQDAKFGIINSCAVALSWFKNNHE